MTFTRNPPGVHDPIVNIYSHATEVPAGARLLFVAGQVGVDPDSSSVGPIAAQLDQAWANVGAILQDAGMSFADIVKVTVFLTDEQYSAEFERSCRRHLKDHAPSMTGIIGIRLWSPDWAVEFDVVAATAA